MEESFREMRGHALESSSLSSPFLDGISALRGGFDAEANQSGFANNIFTLHFPNLLRSADAFSFLFLCFLLSNLPFFFFPPISISSSPFFFFFLPLPPGSSLLLQFALPFSLLLPHFSVFPKKNLHFHVLSTMF